MHLFSLATAARVLSQGGCLVYPTETFFALGALATHAGALARIVAIKARPATKPLPLLVGELAHLERIVPDGFLDGPLGEDFRALAGRFWPGPLSLVVPCREELPGLVKDGQGRVSVRWTPHPTAAALCRLAGGAIVATSANVSGKPPAARAEDLDPAVVSAADGLVTEGPRPSGGQASTVIGLLGGRRLVLFRDGAVAVATLRAAGYEAGPA
ncbi:Sua5/YciO/YrdC/YwlC family protein [Solidesulfovibrio carbinoliphilus subsp. oakridgensis]|uniref:L-threonylcarbamoyladenylate synthase n=1 Tax=Solidesulfovibrio carbinoliphilus subsp. oakridgensis TaxID=694327 RepID=G7QDL5_9BACT|nr:L-threonylcarbamoyladenylate synthase [Solidesulfovibrio carbinoliphilus]EHJ46521.1 Sua5/YciO/YrdC/YwlC family protein [Solidesulfovibrio carbinoliphilus subsp. oakridgensis]